MTCSCVRYVFLCFLILCSLCPGEYFLHLKGEWGIFENIFTIDGKLSKSTDRLYLLSRFRTGRGLVC